MIKLYPLVLYKCIYIFIFLTQFLLDNRADDYERISIKDVDWCASPYCKNKTLHTICMWGLKCLPAKGCETSVDFNKQMKDYVMELHNEKRNKIALGQEPNLPDDLPKAANMRALQWDIHLEYVARCHSRQCDHNHDYCRVVPRFSTVGQNIYTKTVLEREADNLDIRAILDQAVDSWYTQVQNVPAGIYAKWDKTKKPSAEFTQMIWARTGHMGCGLSYGKKEDSKEFFLVCNYGPEGNVKGKSIYFPGTPCSKCFKGEYCNSKYKGLCGEIEEYALKCPCEGEK